MEQARRPESDTTGRKTLELNPRTLQYLNYQQIPARSAFIALSPFFHVFKKKFIFLEFSVCVLLLRIRGKFGSLPASLSGKDEKSKEKGNNFHKFSLMLFCGLVVHAHIDIYV
jgi:hypothetical protein